MWIRRSPEKSRTGRVVTLAVAGAAAIGLAGFGIAIAMPASAASMVAVYGGGPTEQAAIEDGYNNCVIEGYSRAGTVLDIIRVIDVPEPFELVTMACHGPDGKIAYR